MNREVPRIVRAVSLLAGCAMLAAWIGAGKNSDFVAARAGYLPTMTGIDLNGEDRVVPEFFPGKLNLVVFAFLREQQEMANTWIKFYRELNGQYPELEFFEVPLLERARRARRFAINNGMRSGVKSPVGRKRTITVYTDRERFLETMDMVVDDIYPMVVDDEGKILWRGRGTADRDNVAAVRRLLTRIHDPTGDS